MKSRKIVILTGAGISAESGLKTFRDNNGLWENHNVYDVATPEAFLKNPGLVQRFYNQRRNQLLSDEVVVNKAHIALGNLEKKLEGEVLVITQNVDDLHERGGSQNIIHMHGELLKVRCVNTNMSYQWCEDITDESVCDCCKERGTLRPDIVWFGEEIKNLKRIQAELSTCDLFLSIGTSAQVFPAGQFVKWVSPYCKTIEINKERTDASIYFDEVRLGNATTVVEEIVQEILKVDRND